MTTTGVHTFADTFTKEAIAKMFYRFFFEHPEHDFNRKINSLSSEQLQTFLEVVESYLFTGKVNSAQKAALNVLDPSTTAKKLMALCKLSYGNGFEENSMPYWDEAKADCCHLIIKKVQEKLGQSSRTLTKEKLAEKFTQFFFAHPIYGFDNKINTAGHMQLQTFLEAVKVSRFERKLLSVEKEALEIFDTTKNGEMFLILCRQFYGDDFLARHKQCFDKISENCIKTIFVKIQVRLEQLEANQLLEAKIDLLLSNAANNFAAIDDKNDIDLTCAESKQLSKRHKIG